MCGIVGYVGNKEAAPILLDGLKKLEYRGYDSAGLAILNGDLITVKKTKGRLQKLIDYTDAGRNLPGTIGLGHTRWATHGEPNDQNSHPHLSHSNCVAVVHNGIIENYIELREFLIGKGYVFSSDTDTEVIAQLLDYYYNGDASAAIRHAVSDLEGSYALGILFSQEPNQLIAVRKDSPLIIGISEGENFIASDIPAILKYTRNVFRLGENEIAVITKDTVTVTDKLGMAVNKTIEHVDWDADAAEKGGYPHFMIKEIEEQPITVKNTVGSCVKSEKIDFALKAITESDFKNASHIHIVACGSAYHVGAVGKVLLEKYTRIPTTVSLASEFRYMDPIIDKSAITIAISQSGETIDTLFAMREAKKRGSKTLAIINVVGSTIANEADDVIYTRAGPEIAVATTKAYTAQLVVLYMLTAYIGTLRGTLTGDPDEPALTSLKVLPALLSDALRLREETQFLASRYFMKNDIFFLGRNLDYALALEASLKLKEISYIHSEAYAAGELKHGTISLVEKGTLVIALLTHEPLIAKMISNIREVKSRGAIVIALVNEGTNLPENVADHVIAIKKCAAFMQPSIAILPLQLFAYYVASLRGCDIDKPRNLAKSVTVE
ncbi:MAG: glutamine--fructose-6-phosphate transaminase (isomerizing) [Clostridia bacterium]